MHLIMFSKPVEERSSEAVRRGGERKTESTERTTEWSRGLPEKNGWAASPEVQ